MRALKLLPALVALASIADVQPLVIGGKEVPAGSPIAAVTVAVRDASGFCSGTIIADDIVVTAAHCLDGPASGVRVAYGTSVLNGGAIQSQVHGYEKNPDWKGATGRKLWGDMAIVRIKGRLPDGYQPAQVLAGGLGPRLGDEVVIAGFGVVSVDPWRGTGTLRSATAAVVSVLTEHDIAADSGTGVGACFGDSGGPAFVVVDGRHLVWGVTSRSFPYDAPRDCSKGTVFTSIPSYAEWITAATTRLRRLP